MLTIATLVKEFGAKNIRVIMPAQPLRYQGFIPGLAIVDHSDPLTPDVEFEFDLQRYDPSEGYKMRLIPASEQDRMQYAGNTFYNSDFETLARGSGGIRVMLLTIDGYETLWYKEYQG